MGALKQESMVYAALQEKYNTKKGDISEPFYKECVACALKYEKRELQYALFVLKYVNEDVNTGSGTVDKVLNLCKLAGNTLRTAFIVNVLEVALEEK